MTKKISSVEHSLTKQFSVMLCLIIAGETVFCLPFHITRYFRPTFIEVFGITHLELGWAQSTYGVVAMLAYFPGGLLADSFSSRKLLSLALLLTGLGGFYLASIPDLFQLSLLWAFWGGTSIFLLWGALIHATRMWGGALRQGLAYGTLDCGRGLFSVSMALLAAQSLSGLISQSGSDLLTPEARLQAFQNIIFIYTSVTLLAAALVWIFIPESQVVSKSSHSTGDRLSKVFIVIRQPLVWLNACIIVSAYVAWKGADNFGLFARDVYGYSEVDSAWISSMSSWMRPFIALIAGITADRWVSSRLISLGFILLILTFLTMGFFPVLPANIIQPAVLFPVYTIIAGIGIYGIRGIYFSLMEEASLDRSVTGTAVGLISCIGFTPDIFMGIVQGYFLDHYPEKTGHQYFWLFIAMTSTVGFLASTKFSQITEMRQRSLGKV